MSKAQAQAPQLCDHCHSRPKHAGHPYCSRTCAKEAGTAASSKTCIQCHHRPKFHGFDFCGKTCAALSARAAQASKPSKGPKQQQKPPTQNTPAPQDNPVIQSQTPAPAAFPTVSVTKPASPEPLIQHSPVPTSIPPPAQINKCRIDGCFEPAETDLRGSKISDYCSQEHAEDAVLSGIAKGCVMCLHKPQSDSNYFCSQACKDKSMHK